MPRPSPQTERVVSVIEYLSDRSDGASSTQIAHDTGINASTCVHVLATLTSAGFLYREPSDRRYHLGPALVRPGRVAEERYEFQAIARAEMQVLTSIHNRPCFAFAPDGDHARLEQYTCQVPHGPPYGSATPSRSRHPSARSSPRGPTTTPSSGGCRSIRAHATGTSASPGAAGRDPVDRSRDRDGRQPVGRRRGERSRPSTGDRRATLPVAGPDPPPDARGPGARRPRPDRHRSHRCLPRERRWSAGVRPGRPDRDEPHARVLRWRRGRGGRRGADLITMSADVREAAGRATAAIVRAA